MSQNHPDKLIAKKASASLIQKANEKTQAISKAYESICEYKGW
jgi:DnaJ like chaperone protein